MFWQSFGKRSTWYEIGKPARLPSAPNTYFGVNPSMVIPPTNSAGDPAECEHIATQNAYIAAVNCFYAEFDAKDYGGKEGTWAHVQELPVQPSVTNDSGGGYHSFWLFDQPVMIADEATRERMIQAQSDWVFWMGGDKGAKDLRRVLRVPGTTNVKYDPPREVAVIDANWELYESGFLLDICRANVEPIKRSAALGNVGVIAPTPRPYNGPSLIEKFNADHPLQEQLSKGGYGLNKTGTRFTRPGKNPRDGISGVVSESNGKNVAYTFSSGDPMFDDKTAKRHTFDSFDVFVKVQHNGDLKAAIEDVKAGRV